MIPTRPHHFFGLNVTGNKESYYVGLNIECSQQFKVMSLSIAETKFNELVNGITYY